MIKNLSTAKLLGILAVLVLIYIGFEFFDGGNRSKSYREVLVEIDTAKVDKIVIEKSGEKLDLVKKAGQWEVGISENKFAKASDKTIENTLNTLLSIKSSRIVAKNPEKWKEYQVDSAGTRVKIFEGDEETLDIILGRFGFKSQREYSTYVRLADEDEVYAADNFMAMSINTDANRFRNSQVARIKKDSISSIEFNYPDSSFTLTNDSINWKIAETATDSATTAKFFSGLSHLTSSAFYDEGVPSGTASLTVKFNKTNHENLEIKAWKRNEGWIINSTGNPESYFSDEALFEKVFKGKDAFLKKEEE